MERIDEIGMKGKLRPLEILRRIGVLAYDLAFPPSLQQIHNVFHVSMLRKYNLDSSNVIEYECMEAQPEVSYIEHPIEIVEQTE